jgi:hypothetical protein
MGATITNTAKHVYIQIIEMMGMSLGLCQRLSNDA